MEATSDDKQVLYIKVLPIFIIRGWGIYFRTRWYQLLYLLSLLVYEIQYITSTSGTPCIMTLPVSSPVARLQYYYSNSQSNLSNDSYRITDLIQICLRNEVLKANSSEREEDPETQRLIYSSIFFKRLVIVSASDLNLTVKLFSWYFHNRNVSRNSNNWDFLSNRTGLTEGSNDNYYTLCKIIHVDTSQKQRVT
jgi:hypothetical protein